MPTEHERETAFLRRCIRYDASPEGAQLHERIAQVQRDERCLRRAAWLMALVAALAVAGLGYGAVLLDDFPNHMSVFTTLFVIKIITALAIASSICLLAFTGMGFVYRRELNRRREECRLLVSKLLESHPRNSHAPLQNGELKEHEAFALKARIAAQTAEQVNQPRMP